MIGLLEMAARLAEQRANAPDSIHGGNGAIGLAARFLAEGNPALVPATAEYYRIIDRLSRGEPA